MAKLPYWHDGAGKIWTKADITIPDSGNYKKSFYAYYNNDLTPALQSGLVAYYKFDGNANDSSGNGYNGTVTGATLTDNNLKKSNSAYSFNGSSNYITMGTSQRSSGSSGITIALWIYPLTNTTEKGLVIANYGGSKFSFLLSTVAVNDLLMACYGSTHAYTSGSVVTNNTWNHIVFTYNGSGFSTLSNYKIYVNGSSLSLSNTGTHGGTNHTNNYIGCEYGPVNYYNGKIGTVCEWNRALSSTEVTDLYNLQKGTYFSGDNTFEFFDDFEGSTLNASKWNSLLGTGGTETVSNSELTISGSGSQRNICAASATAISSGVGRFFTRYSPNSTSSMNLQLGIGVPYVYTTGYSTATIRNWVRYNSTPNIYAYKTGTDYTLGSTTLTNTYHTGELNLLGTSGTYTVDGTKLVDLTSTHIDTSVNYTPVIYYHGTQYSSKIDYIFTAKNTTATITPSYGTEETGTYSVDGKYFTKRRPVTITSSVSLTGHQVELDYSNFNNQADIILEDITNQPPTTPTDIAITPTTLYANSLVGATASGSTDPDSDAFTYYYQFYDLTSSTLLQDYSSDNDYQLTSSNAHHTLRIGAKAHQTSGGSESSAYTENFSVTNTAPSIPTDITAPSSTPADVLLTFTASGSTDTVDNDTLTYYYEFYDVTTAETLQSYSTTNSITIPVARQGNTIRVKTKSYDGYGYSSEYYEDYLISGVLWAFDFANNELLIGTTPLISKPIFKHPTSTVQGCTLVTGNLPEDLGDNVDVYAYTSDGSYLLTSNQLTTFPATHELKLKLVNNSASTYTVPMIDTLGRNIILKIKYS